MPVPSLFASGTMATGRLSLGRILARSPWAQWPHRHFGSARGSAHWGHREPEAQALSYPSCLRLQSPSLAYSSRLAYSDSPVEGQKKPSLAVRFKQMFKDYWYVLVPVHVATSVVWFGGFFVLCKSGVDVGSILTTLGASEAYVVKLQSSNLGYYAMAYACYKVATPARYTVTLGGTTLTIKKCREYGWLKTTSEMASDMKGQSENVRHRVEDLKDKMEDGWEKLSHRKKKD